MAHTCNEPTKAALAMRKYRQNLKSGKSDEYEAPREKEAKRLRKFRKVMSLEKRAKYQAKTNERMRKFRQRKKRRNKPSPQLPI